MYHSELACTLEGASADDLTVVNGARVSLDVQHSEMEEGDDKLIAFLMREKHGSPFEHGYFRFRVHAPIFVAREHMRHRAGHSYNEVSGRYSELKPEFYVPEQWRTQVGKPGAYTFEQHPRGWDLSLSLQYAYEQSWKMYQHLLEQGVAREQARMVLPVGLFTTYIWSCNPRSLMHFLSLRNAPPAMAEIRTVAEQAERVLADRMPVTYAAYVASGRVAP